MDLLLKSKIKKAKNFSKISINSNAGCKSGVVNKNCIKNSRVSKFNFNQSISS